MKNKDRRQLVLSVGWKGNKVYSSLCEPISKKYNLTQNEIDVIAFLKNFGDIDTAKEISRYRVISKSLICKSVKALISRGFLLSEQDDLDKRMQHLIITPTAMPIAEEIINIQDQFFTLLYSGVTDEEDRVLTNILTKISTNLENSIGDLGKKGQ